MKIFSKKNYIFKRFLISYLLIWILPIIICSAAYYKSYDTIVHNAVESTISKLGQSSSVIDSRLNEIRNMVERIAMSRNLNMALTQDLYLYQYGSLQSDLVNYRITNNFIKSISICLKDKGITVSTDIITDKSDVFYEYDLKPLGMNEAGSYTEFLDKHYLDEYFLSKTNAEDTIIKNSEPDITYISSFPIGGKTRTFGAIMVNIQQKELQNMLKEILQKDEWLYVIDNKGNIITSVNDKGVEIKSIWNEINIKNNTNGSKIDKNDTVISYVVSPQNGWVYIAGFSKKSIMSRLDSIKYFTIWTVVVVVVIGLLIAFFMANKNSKPITGLLDMVRSKFNDAGQKNAFEFLKGSILELLKNNEELKNEIKEKLPLLKVAFMDRLLRGGFNSADELMITMKNADVNLQAAKYAVVVAEIKLQDKNQYNENENGMFSGINIAKLITARTIETLFSEKVLIHEVGKDKLALLFSFSFEDDMQIKNVINNVSSEVNKHLLENNGLYVRFAAGLAYSTLFDVYRSFDEALQASEYKTMDDNDIIMWYMKAPAENNYYYYPIEIENKIINLVKVGNAEKIYALLDILYNENMVIRKIPENMLAYLFSEMKGTFMRLFSYINFEQEDFHNKVKDKADEISMENSIQDNWNHIKDLYTAICDEVNNFKNQYYSQLKNKILEYIESCYMDQQLNRYQVASKFGVSEVYLSKYFKEQTGECLSKYIEQLRMKKASELLSQTNTSISDIAERVGYSSARAFRRAYTRFYGILPSEGRDGTDPE